MNERLMRFGAVMHDSWWIFVLALLVGGGIGWAVQSLQPAWLAWVLGMTFSAGMAMVVGRLMNWWHDRCEMRRWRKILAMRVPLTAAFWQMTKGDDDGALSVGDCYALIKPSSEKQASDFEARHDPLFGDGAK